MLRKFLIIFMILLGIACIVGFLTVETPPEIIIIKVPPAKPIRQVPEIVDRVNQRNSKVTSLSCDDVVVAIWKNHHRFKLSADLNYQKAKSFRLQIRSLFGDEMDIGSNDSLFWYWSRRDKKPGLYFAKYEDFNRTRLKAPFNPIFLRGSLGIDPIQLENATFSASAGKTLVARNTLSATGQKIVHTIIIDSASERIEGSVIADEAGKVIASSQIEGWNSDAPSKIIYNWAEEEQVMSLELKNPKLNVTISGDRWTLPDKFKPQINMGQD